MNSSLEGVCSYQKSKEIKQKELEKKHLLDLYQSGIISLNDIKSNLNDVKKNINKLKQENEMLLFESKQSKNHIHLVERIEDFKKRYSNNINILSETDKTKILRCLVKNIEVDSINAEITINHLIPLEKYPLCTRRAFSFTL